MLHRMADDSRKNRVAERYKFNPMITWHYLLMVEVVHYLHDCNFTHLLTPLLQEKM
jgi:hypothetical protein